jgi:hypothetical protein
MNRLPSPMEPTPFVVEVDALDVYAEGKPTAGVVSLRVEPAGGPSTIIRVRPEIAASVALRIFAAARVTAAGGV